MKLSLNQMVDTSQLRVDLGFNSLWFLYAAQIKAAQTGNLWMGTVTMLAFDWGRCRPCWGSASRLSADRRSQLFKMGGCNTTIGLLTSYGMGMVAQVMPR